MLRACAIDYD
jgi:hypothetical protein